MKHTKRMLAILMTLAMVLSMTFAMSATAFAAPPADTPLTITGLAEGDVAHFYKIVKWDPDNEDNVAGWVAVSPFDDVLDKDTLTEVLVGVKDDPDTDADESKDPTLITSDLAGQLAKKVTGVSPTDVTVGEDGKASLTLTEGGEGLYMALITPVDVDTVYNPVFVSSDFDNNETNTWAVDENATYSDEAAAKKNTVELKKTASTTEDSWDDKKWNTTAIGDTVSFTVETTIPGYGEVYTNPVFIIRDKLADLKLKTDTVTLVEPTGLTKNTDYTISATDTGYTITFSADYLKTCAAPTNVKVTYDAIVTTTAPVHVNTEKNEVSTEFSHDPSNESDHGFKKDTTQHYTFTIDAEGLGGGGDKSGLKTSELVKVGVDAQGNPVTEKVEYSEITEENSWESPLAGAVFGLFTDDKGTVPYKAKNADGTPGDTAMTATTGADGRMNFKGLDAGTYYLKEISAPAGYVADTAIHEVKISATTESVEITEYTTDGQTWISAEDYEALSEEQQKAYKSYTYETDVLASYTITIDGEHVAASYTFTNKGTDPEIVWTEEGPVELPFQIVNTKGTELPSTGGIGTIIFYVFGTILVLGCGIVLISRRRVHNK